MPKQKHIRPLTWSQLWTKLKKLGLRVEEVDISVGDDRLSSGDEDHIDDDDNSDDETASDRSDEEEDTTDEVDADDLTEGTPFNQMTPEQFSEHAKSGWTTYFEDSCTFACIVQDSYPLDPDIILY
ncbi:hypothetical protein V7S43_009567 [Phytophthora oleae]|uniref:PiggyBac transposable element-derived protein domain-containing protein n=1 Tax=Phytophthora oleae TaxID=2107226 RepID=A0ABD3FGJ5_9STRA